MATAEGAPVNMQTDSVQRDEFIIDMNKVKLIADAQDRIRDLFQVTFTYGDKVDDPSMGNKQWIEVEGSFDDRQLAKDYVRALCNPMEEECIHYPMELDHVLRSKELQDRIEKQSRTVLRYNEPGEISILGNEQLSVTLAYSALEDVISQHLEDEHWDVEQTFATPKPSNRLDAELMRRLSTEDGTGVDEDQLTSMNNAIKRTILDVLNTNKDKTEATMEDFGIKPHMPPNLAASSQGTTPTTHKSSPQRSSPGAARAGKRADSLGEAAKQLGQIQITKETGDGDPGEPVSSDTTPVMDPSKSLRDFALNKGYAADKIDRVFAKHGRDMKFTDFYRALDEIDKVPEVASSTSVDSAVSTPISVSSDPEDAADGKKDGSPKLHSRQVVSYIARLSRDHDEEEEIGNIEELKYRNAERQRLLMEVFEKRKAKIEEDAEMARAIAVQISDSEETETKVEIDLTEDTPPSDDQVDSRQRHPKPTPNHNNAPRSYNQQQNHGHRSRSPVKYSDQSHSHYVPGRSPSPKRYKHDKRQTRWEPPPPSHNNGQQQSHIQASGRTSMGIRTNLRYIVIDGSNLAMTHGNGQVFSCRGIELCVDYFLKRGHKQITAFVPQWRTRTLPSADYPIRDQHLLDDLRKQGYLVFTPSRRVPGKNIVCYDDRYVLRLAQETEGVIVSNDNYRDLWLSNREWRPIIEQRLLMFSFVMDIFMPPDDPLGKDGPDIEEFLQIGGPSGGSQGGPTGGWQGGQQHGMQGGPQHRPQGGQQHGPQGGPPNLMDINPANRGILGEPPRGVPMVTGEGQRNVLGEIPYMQQQQQPYNQQYSHQPRYSAANPSYSAATNTFPRPSYAANAQPHQPSHYNNPGTQRGRHPQQHGQSGPNRFSSQQQYGNRPQYNQNFVPQHGNQARPRNQGMDTTDGDTWQHVPLRQQPKPGKTRPEATTKKLLQDLKAVFTDQEQVIQRILKENPAEEDLNTLSGYVLNFLDNS